MKNYGGKPGKDSPLPKGDQFHIYPQGSSSKREAYPDMPDEVMKCRERNIKATNSGQYGMRH